MGQTKDHPVPPRMSRLLPPLRSATALALVLLAGMPLSGCGGDSAGFFSHPIQARGNRVDADQLAQLVPGTTTRTDVMALLGSPTARATFDDNTWLYIFELTKPVIAATNAVHGQQTVALAFDQGGILRKVEQKGLEDSVPVDVVARKTATPGNDTSFIQQLLGNVGRFNPGGPGGGLGGSSGTRSNY